MSRVFCRPSMWTRAARLPGELARQSEQLPEVGWGGGEAAVRRRGRLTRRGLRYRLAHACHWGPSSEIDWNGPIDVAAERGVATDGSRCPAASPDGGRARLLEGSRQDHRDYECVTIAHVDLGHARGAAPGSTLWTMVWSRGQALGSAPRDRRSRRRTISVTPARRSRSTAWGAVRGGPGRPPEGVEPSGRLCMRVWRFLAGGIYCV